MLQGIALANPDTLRYVPEYNLIMRAGAPRENKVSVIQGSGSGHEPSHVMAVGKGMLDAACPGDGIAVGTLIVNDDVAVKDSTWTVGRRGVAGNFFVIKAVGAASEQGADLEELIRIGEKGNSVTRTMGMA